MTLQKQYRKIQRIRTDSSLWLDAGMDIKAWRLANGLSIRELAKLVRLSKSLIADVEVGKRNPYIVLQRICHSQQEK